MRQPVVHVVQYINVPLHVYMYIHVHWVGCYKIGHRLVVLWQTLCCLLPSLLVVKHSWKGLVQSHITIIINYYVIRCVIILERERDPVYMMYLIWAGNADYT